MKSFIGAVLFICVAFSANAQLLWKVSGNGLWRAENVGNADTGHHAENATGYDDRQRQYAVHPPLP